MSGFKLKVANSGLDHNSAFRDHLKRGGIRVLYQKKISLFDASLHRTDRPRSIIAPPKFEKPRL